MGTPAPQPSVAERARTVLCHASPVVVEIGTQAIRVVDVHAVDADGSLVLLVPADGRLAERTADGPTACTVHAALVGPVPGPDRLLDRVVAHGHVGLAADIGEALDVIVAAHPDRPVEAVLRPDAAALLRVTVEHLLLDAISVGARPVDPGAYARARPDPLAPGSDEFVEHLLRGHTEQVVRLAHLLEPGFAVGAHAVAPVRVDRFGFTYRVDTATGSRHTRLDFPAALRGPDELPAAMRELQSRAAQVTGCPFSGEPRRTPFS